MLNTREIHRQASTRPNSPEDYPSNTAFYDCENEWDNESPTCQSPFSDEGQCNRNLNSTFLSDRLKHLALAPLTFIGCAIAIIMTAPAALAVAVSYKDSRELLSMYTWTSCAANELLSTPMEHILVAIKPLSHFNFEEIQHNKSSISNKCQTYVEKILGNFFSGINESNKFEFSNYHIYPRLAVLLINTAATVGLVVDVIFGMLGVVGATLFLGQSERLNLIAARIILLPNILTTVTTTVVDIVNPHNEYFFVRV